MIYYYEFCKTVSNRVACLIPKEELDGKTGFRSVYGYDDGTADYFREIGSVRGASNFHVFSNELIMDIDDNDTEAERIAKVLSDMEYAYEVWHTGNRGYHIRLEHAPIFDRRLPYSQREWVVGNKFNTDLCLYTQNHLIRLPRTRHAKTGKYKTLEHKSEGRMIEFPLIDKPIYAGSGASGEGEFDLNELAMIFNRMALNMPGKGERNHKLFALGMGILSCGLSEATVEDIVTRYNDSLPEPLDDQEITAVIQSACRTVRG
jgi:hypothetical protein